MEEVKQCPYCGKEIHISAKKCRHCGKWLEKKCPVCGEWILTEAKKCKHCGSWINKFTREKYESQQISAKPTQTKEQIKEEIDDAKDKNDASCLLQIENGLIIGAIWFVYDKIWVPIIVFIILEVLLRIQAIRVLYCLAATFVWGAVGMELSGGWGTVLFAGLSLVFHYPAMKSGFN